MLKVIALIISFVSFSVSAEKLDGFNKRFKIIKNDQGKVTYVQMKSLTTSLSVLPYIKMTISDIKSEIQRRSNKGYDSEMDAFFAELEDGDFKSTEQEESITALRKSLKKLDAIDIDLYIAKIENSGLFTMFQAEFKKALEKYSLANIAATEDAKYFYKRNVTYEVVTRVLEFAKKKFDSVPMLNLISTVIVRVHDMVLEQRLHNQNILLHYLENVHESDLGMSKEDVDFIFSSIYESRISAMNYRESRTAASAWAKYGLNKFYSQVRMGNDRLRRSERNFDSIGNRYNWAFADVIENGEKVVKNLILNKHSFSSKMSTAYNYNKPEQVKRFRSLLNMAQIGLGFIPLPNWLKTQAESFIDSYYVEQKKLEGALIGYFEFTQNEEMARRIKSQMVNPYLR